MILGEFVQDINESKLSTKERKSLDDLDFGIPDKRKYPLNDKSHVLSAIKMFNHANKEDEEELADNILSAMSKYNISKDTIGNNNRLKNYIEESVLSEGLIWNGPKETKELKNRLYTEIEILSIKRDEGLANNLKDMASISEQDSINMEVEDITSAMKKCRCDIIDIETTTNMVKGVAVSHSHHAFAYYKKYIVDVAIQGFKGRINKYTYITIVYDESKCDIPKNVIDDMIKKLSSNINKISCTRKQVKIKSNARVIDNAFGYLFNKYNKSYKVKKSPIGTSISISTLRKSIKESSSAVASAIPSPYSRDKVFIVNYTMKNTFVDDTAICRDLMSDIHICQDGKAKRIGLTDLQDIAEDIEVYEFYNACDFNQIIKDAKSGEDFYRKLTMDESVSARNICYDPKFKRVDSFIDQLESIKESIIASAPNDSFTVLPLVESNEDFSNVKYYKDIHGVFAMNESTGMRSNYYSDINEIPKSTINLLSNI